MMMMMIKLMLTVCFLASHSLVSGFVSPGTHHAALTNTNRRVVVEPFRRFDNNNKNARFDQSLTRNPTALYNSLTDKVSSSLVQVSAAFVALLLALSAINIIDTGEIGVVSRLGSLSVLEPGPHLVVPLISSVSRLSTKTQLLEQSNFVPTKEGLTVELDTAILYKLQPNQVESLVGTVGRDYATKVIEPEASSAVRGLTSESEAKALYTSGRTDIQNKLREELRASLGPRGITVEDVLLKAVKLPKELSDSIEQKAKAEQESARMEFVLQKEQLEAKRKAIEAEGIADFQRIVTKGITPDLLQWKGIEATEMLSKSPNSKIVIMGNGKNSLPVILNGDK